MQIKPNKKSNYPKTLHNKTNKRKRNSKPKHTSKIHQVSPPSQTSEITKYQQIIKSKSQSNQPNKYRKTLSPKPVNKHQNTKHQQTNK